MYGSNEHGDAVHRYRAHRSLSQLAHYASLQRRGMYSSSNSVKEWRMISGAAGSPR